MIQPEKHLDMISCDIAYPQLFLILHLVLKNIDNHQSELYKLWFVQLLAAANLCVCCVPLPCLVVFLADRNIRDLTVRYNYPSGPAV